MGIANVDSAARVCHAPSTVGLKATIGVAASTCSLQRRDRDRPRRAVGHEPGQQPAGVHEVPVPGQAQRAPRSWWSTRTSSPGLERYWVPSNVESALFGTKICDLHVPGAAGRRRRVRQRRAEAAHRPGRGRPALRRRATPRAGTSWWPRSTPSRSTTCSAGPASTGPCSTRSSTCTRAAGRVGADLVDGHHPAPASAVDGVRAIVNVGPGPGQRRARRRRAHAHPRPLRRAGRRRDGRLRHRPPRRRRRSTPDVAAALWPSSGASSVPGRAGADRARDGRGGRAGATSTCCGSPAATSSTSCPTPPRSRAALGAGARCGSTRTSCVTSQMLVDGDDVILLPVATRYEQEGGGTETTTERRIVFSPEIPRQVGEARSEWRLFAESRPGSGPTVAARPSPGPTTAPSRAEIARVVPAYAGIEHLDRHRRRGAVGRPAPVRRRRVPHRPTAGAGSARSSPRPSDRARGHVHGRHPPGQAVQLDRVDARPTRSPAPAATPSTSTPPTPPRWAWPRAVPCVLRSEVGEMRAVVHLARLPRAERSRSTGRRATCCSPAARRTASPARASPTTTPWWRSSRAEPALRHDPPGPNLPCTAPPEHDSGVTFRWRAPIRDACSGGAGDRQGGRSGQVPRRKRSISRRSFLVGRPVPRDRSPHAAPAGGRGERCSSSATTS